MKNLILVSLLVSGVTFTACQKEESVSNPIPASTENLAQEVAGTFIGLAEIAGQQIEGYELKVSRVKNNVIRIEGQRISSEEFILVRDENLGNIASYTEDSHLVIYIPDEKVFTIVRLVNGSEEIAFDGKKK